MFVILLISSFIQIDTLLFPTFRSSPFVFTILYQQEQVIILLMAFIQNEIDKMLRYLSAKIVASHVFHCITYTFKIKTLLWRDGVDEQFHTFSLCTGDPQKQLRLQL